MNSDNLDNKLRLLLNEYLTTSRLRTIIQIKLADYSAQLCGCRSTRQIDQVNESLVDEVFQENISLLDDMVNEIIDCLNEPHAFKLYIYCLDDHKLELTLEDAIYEMVISDDRMIFKEMFIE